MKFICDRCKKEIPWATYYIDDKIPVPMKSRVFYEKNGAPMFAFCDDCNNSFSEWYSEMLPHDYEPYYMERDAEG